MGQILNSRQERIYSEKVNVPSSELLKIIENENKFIFDMVYVVKLILIERGEMSASSLPQVNENKVLESRCKENRTYLIKGPPFNRKFSIESKIVILLSLVMWPFLIIFKSDDNILRLVNNKMESTLFFLLLIFLSLKIWAFIISRSYAKEINRSKGYPFFCFLFPIVGLLILRYSYYRFDYPEIEELYFSAIKFNENQTNQIKKKKYKKLDRKRILIKQSRDINTKLNEVLNEYINWKENTDIQKTSVESERKLDELKHIFDLENYDIPTTTDLKANENNLSVMESLNYSTCPACGFDLKKGEKECPDCGISLA